MVHGSARFISLGGDKRDLAGNFAESILQPKMNLTAGRGQVFSQHTWQYCKRLDTFPLLSSPPLLKWA